MPITSRRKVMSSHLLVQGPAFAGYCYSHPNCWSDFAPPWIAHALHIKDPITHYLAAFWTLDANHCCISPINCLLIGCPRNEGGLVSFFVHDLSMEGNLRLMISIKEPCAPFVNGTSLSPHLSSLQWLCNFPAISIFGHKHGKKEEDKGKKKSQTVQAYQMGAMILSPAKAVPPIPIHSNLPSLHSCGNLCRFVR